MTSRLIRYLSLAGVPAMLAAAAILMMSAPAGAQQTFPCPINMKGYANLPFGRPLTCSCGPGQMRGTVWGTDRYTDDSSVCRAARHAGMIGSGGLVNVFRGTGCPSFRGSFRNGVATRNYGRWPRSFAFNYPVPPCVEQARVPPPPDGLRRCPSSMSGYARMPDGRPFTCRCLPGQVRGSVWGSARYTTDSSVCAAARHAGRIGPGGGVVTVFLARGCPRFFGSRRNGIGTGNWGPYRRTFTFRFPPPACTY